MKKSIKYIMVVVTTMLFMVGCSNESINTVKINSMYSSISANDISADKVEMGHMAVNEYDSKYIIDLTDEQKDKLIELIKTSEFKESNNKEFNDYCDEYYLYLYKDNMKVEILLEDNTDIYIFCNNLFSNLYMINNSELLDFLNELVIEYKGKRTDGFY